MSAYRRILKVLSVILIVWGCMAVVGSAFVTLGVGIGLEEEGLAAMSEGTSEELFMFVTMSLIVLLLVGGVLSIIGGALGLRGAKNPKRVTPFFVVSIIMLVCWLLTFVVSLLIEGATMLVVGVGLALSTFSVICVYCAYALRKAVKNGVSFDDDKEPARAPLGAVMTVIQTIFALNIVIVLAALTTLIKGNYELTFPDILDMANLVFDGVSFWLIFKRSKAARYWVCGFSLFNIVIGTIVNVVDGGFNLNTQFFSSWFDIFLLLYFLLARKPKEVLTNKFDVRMAEHDKRERWSLWQPKTWEFWRSMIMFFFLFSIVGHWMEAALCLLIKYGIVPGTYDPNSQIWSDWLYPFPVYGCGMIACAVILYPIKVKLQEKLSGTWKPLVCSFVINSLVCAAIELTLGLTSNMPDANGVYPLWDYSNMFCNFMGQICLQNTLAFGTVATLMTWVVYPALQRMLIRLPKDMGNAIFVAVTVFGLITVCLYLVNVTV